MHYLLLFVTLLSFVSYAPSINAMVTNDTLNYTPFISPAILLDNIKKVIQLTEDEIDTIIQGNKYYYLPLHFIYKALEHMLQRNTHAQITNTATGKQEYIANFFIPDESYPQPQLDVIKFISFFKNNDLESTEPLVT